MQPPSSRLISGVSARRVFLRSTVLALAGAWLSNRRGPAALLAATSRGDKGPAAWRRRPRPDLLDRNSPKGLAVFQLTTETHVPGSHLYMEAQVFTPDSQKLLLHRSATAHGSSKDDPQHQYLLCDLENEGALLPLTHETGATAPSVTPDGKHLYYFVDETQVGGGRLTLKRVNLDGRQRQTVMVVDAPLPGTRCRPSHIYPLSTIASDGKRLALSCFLGDGTRDDPPWGLTVFDLDKAAVSLLLQGPTWCNVHPQYCRSVDPTERRAILVQENHGNVTDARGIVKQLVGGQGADIHVIQDDGANFRNLPWGRDGNEFCQGHQCWRGRTTWALTSTSTRRPPEAQLLEARPVPHLGHLGLKSPGGTRNDLSREFPNPQFAHFATDLAGRRLITDAAPFNQGGRIFLAELGTPGQDPLRNWKFLLNPRTSGGKDSHIHPFLSPDGALGFFNSDESGILQAYSIHGL